MRKNFVLAHVLALVNFIMSQETIDLKCNPSLKHKYEACPQGYCCVRDEFLLTDIYCRRFGKEYDNCTTRDSDSECPCEEGLYCKPQFGGKFPSLYGTCVKNVTTTAATTTTMTTTTKAASSTTMAAASSSSSTSSLSSSSSSYPKTDDGTMTSDAMTTVPAGAASTTTAETATSAAAAANTSGMPSDAGSQGDSTSVVG